MKDKITQADLENAQKELKTHGDITRCCLVYQVLKRNGLAIDSCAFTHYVSNGVGIDLPKSCVEITSANHNDWPNFVGREIELPLTN